jgi:hypothetical protein
MPLGQFDEKLAYKIGIFFDSAYVAPTLEGAANIGEYGGRVDLLTACNSDAVDHFLAVYDTSDTGHPFVVVKIAAGAGGGIIPPVDVLAAAFPGISQPFFLSAKNGPIAFSLEAAPAATKFVTVYGQGGNF